MKEERKDEGYTAKSIDTTILFYQYSYFQEQG